MISTYPSITTPHPNHPNPHTTSFCTNFSPISMEDGPTNTDLDYNLNKLEITNAQHHDEPSQTFSNVIITNDLLYDIVLSYCTPATFLRLSRTSQSAHAAVKSYMGRAFRLDSIYTRFFTSPVAFRQMQARTGALVSGSAALQFFDRSYYPEADMDIYVFAGFRFEVAEFLFQDGYEFVPEEHQKSKFQLAALDSELNIGEYEFKGVITVFTFEKKKVDGKVVKAQIVLAANGPFEAILGFHSTCVMNVISCDTAYSLYPKATFEERTSLVCITSNTTKTVNSQTEIS
ncbi:hypothetical protein QCA50_000730 [Cerrena zonata]|uniref:F-box domain-containing protein n=1 Tax=Cerrena zonata TaxID=2478898 RepID=A0AAW0GZI1_9APHY